MLNNLSSKNYGEKMKKLIFKILMATGLTSTSSYADTFKEIINLSEPTNSKPNPKYRVIVNPYYLDRLRQVHVAENPIIFNGLKLEEVDINNDDFSKIAIKEKELIDLKLEQFENANEELKREMFKKLLEKEYNPFIRVTEPCRQC